MRQLVDLIGITNLIPGPNSTELAMLVGRMRAGGMGLLVAGLAFILPAAAIVLALAWAYVSFGSTPTADGSPVRRQAGDHRDRGRGARRLRPHGPARVRCASPSRVAVAVLWPLGVSELVLLAGGALVVAIARLGASRPWAAVGLVLPAAAGGDIGQPAHARARSS